MSKISVLSRNKMMAVVTLLALISLSIMSVHPCGKNNSAQSEHSNTNNEKQL